MMSRKKDGQGGGRLKKSDISDKSMNSVPGAYFLTNPKWIFIIRARKKMIKRNG